MIKAPPSASFIGTLSLTLLSIAGLFTADTFLEKLDRTENDVAAVRLFKQGQVLLAQGQNAQAIDRFSDAIGIDRSNRQYQRALAQAQLAAGRTSDAEITLSKLLESDSADGQASLLMAHTMMKEGRFQPAVSYFHRAIYAHWNEDETANRRRTRAELIDLLAQRDMKEDLLAELLAVQEQTPKDIKSRIRMGDLLLQAGSPSRAIDVFHGILHDEPGNVDAYKGLGEADFSNRNYRSAQKDFQTAARLLPNDPAIQQRLDVCNQVLALDPTLRGLAADERFNRSSKVLELTLNEIGQCMATSANAEAQQLVDKANGALQAHVSGVRQSEASEANLDLAEQLWQLRKKECKSPPVNRTVALVLARLTQ